MPPRSSRLLDLGLWYLVNQRERAMWWYNRVFMPLAIRFQKPLKLVEGLIADENVDEVLVVCRAAHALECGERWLVPWLRYSRRQS